MYMYIHQMFTLKHNSLTNLGYITKFASRLKFGGLGVYCYRATCYPSALTMLCIAIAFCMWVHEMHIQASSAERDIGIV